MSDPSGGISQDFYLLKVAADDAGQFGHLAVVFTPLRTEAGVLVTAALASDWVDRAGDTLIDALPALVKIMETLAPDDRPRCWVLRDSQGRFDFVVRTGPDTYQTAPVSPLRPGCEPRSLEALENYFSAEARQVARCFDHHMANLQG